VTSAKSLIAPEVIRYGLGAMLVLLLMFAVFAAISSGKYEKYHRENDAVGSACFINHRLHTGEG
jgi:hypothetical protein